ncbi:MAG TPA: DUF4080 domain-containing protein [Clostridia bacterium]|nr:DUF4080 domain-containing protein [Clostridia bacterium]
MKVVLAALNSKYIHMSLAPWYLKSYSGRDSIRVMEFTVNQDAGDILRDIYREKPDVLGFSCYIFNIQTVEQILEDIKKVMPEIKIILGGPEVSFDPRDVLTRCKAVDYVICSAGEIPFKKLLDELESGREPEKIGGVALRAGNGILCNPPDVPLSRSLAAIPSPYTDEMLAQAKGKILYFETSRGCPFHCSYCLSSESGGVRYFPMERVRRDLKTIALSEVRQVKFVDRTFNCNSSRAKEIFRYLIDLSQSLGENHFKNYHFEAAADLFDDEMIELLSHAPEGLFQFEIGIQSFNEPTLDACGRKTDLSVCANYISRLLEAGNIHIHLDLIAGLPLEDLPTFAHSFNSVYALRPHCIQLGFLKLLKGSGMRRDARRHSIDYSARPPYEVLQTASMSFDDLIFLKSIDFCVDRLYNSEKFSQSLKFLISRSESPFRLFSDFSAFLNGKPENGISLKNLYGLLYHFAEQSLRPDDLDVFNEFIKYDYFSSDNSCNPPREIKRCIDPQIKQLYAGLKPGGERVHFERFEIDPLDSTKKFPERKETVLRFDYGRRNRVTGLYGVTPIS